MEELVIGLGFSVLNADLQDEKIIGITVFLKRVRAFILQNWPTAPAQNSSLSIADHFRGEDSVTLPPGY